jgi:hypothetical protein
MKRIRNVKPKPKYPKVFWFFFSKKNKKKTIRRPLGVAQAY